MPGGRPNLYSVPHPVEPVSDEQFGDMLTVLGSLAQDPKLSATEIDELLIGQTRSNDVGSQRLMSKRITAVGSVFAISDSGWYRRISDIDSSLEVQSPSKIRSMTMGEFVTSHALTILQQTRVPQLADVHITLLAPVRRELEIVCNGMARVFIDRKEKDSAKARSLYWQLNYSLRIGAMPRKRYS